MADIEVLKKEELFGNLWEKTYEERRKKVSKKRAAISANAVVYSEALKIFNTKNLKVLLFEEEEPENKYQVYKVDDNTIMLSMDEKILREYPAAERKGQLKKMTDAFEREILSKLLKEHNIQLDPNMFYVINGDG